MFSVCGPNQPLVLTGSLSRYDQMKKEPLSTNGVIIRKIDQQQQLRIIVKYAIYMRQEVVAQLNHLSTLVAIQISRQQSVKPFYQIFDVW